MTIRKTLLVVLSILMLALPAYAELVNCDGVWTNQACEGTSKQSMKEQPHIPRSPEQVAASKRELLIHDMRMLAFDARDVLDIPVSIGSVEAVCSRSDDNVSECAEAASSRRAEIERLLTTHARQEAEKVKQEPQDKRDTTVSIIHNNFSDYYVRRRRLPACCKTRCRYSDKCKPFARIDRDDSFYRFGGIRTPRRDDGNFRNNRNASSSRSSSQGSIWGNPYQSKFR